MSNYAHPESLVSTQWVAEHLDDPAVRIVEVAWASKGPGGMEVYEANHIPGAVAWDYQKDYFSAEHGDLVGRERFEEQLCRSGIGPETTIVLYGGVQNMNATFEFWLLKVYGHRDVRLLDGGRQKWLEENRPLARSVPAYAPTAYRVGQPDWSLRATREDVLRAIEKADAVLVDARTAGMYHGTEPCGTKLDGHIPGAINLAAWRENNPDGSLKRFALPTTQSDGTFVTADELEFLCESVGISRDKAIITYCMRGGASTHAWFVLTQLLGYRNVKEYDRSWAEWGNLENVPIEP